MRNRTEKLNKIRTPYVYADPRKCTACWECLRVCPNQVIVKVGFLWHKHILFNDSDKCSGCRKCMKVCPRGVFTDR